jgi:glutamate dehydrogenase (NAD(P)+)
MFSRFPCTERQDHEHRFPVRRRIMYDHVAVRVDMPDGLSEKIKACNATYVTCFGVRLRGRMFTFRGWRATHSTHGGPAKGGILYAPC